MFSEDLAVFFDTSDFAVTATWQPSDGSIQKTASVILDAPDQSLFGDAVISKDFAITYPQTSLIGLDYDEIVTISGASTSSQNGDYKVLGEPQCIQDGSVTRATLSKINYKS